MNKRMIKHKGKIIFLGFFFVYLLYFWKLVESFSTNPIAKSILVFGLAHISALIFKRILFVEVFSIHEWSHKLIYKLLHCDAKIDIEKGEDKWYVWDKSSYVYSKKTMSWVVVAPISINIITAILIFFIILLMINADNLTFHIMFFILVHLILIFVQN